MGDAVTFHATRYEKPIFLPRPLLKQRPRLFPLLGGTPHLVSPGKVMHHFVERLEPRRLMDAGELDNSFGTDGRVDLDALGITGVDLDVTESSQILVTALTSVAATAETGVASAFLWRLHPDGTRDTRLASPDGGTFALPIPREFMGEHNGFFSSPTVRTVPTPDGGFLVQIASVLYKFRGNGKPDRAFGGGRGKVETAYERHRLLDVTVDAQGRIYLVGPGADGLLAVRRLNADGAVDASFGTEGTAAPTASAIEPSEFRIRVLRDGSIITGGAAGGSAGGTSAAFDFVGVKLTPAGALDTGYGEGGVARTQYFHTDISTVSYNDPAVTADGTVYLSTAERDRDVTTNFAIAVITAGGEPGELLDPAGYSGDVVSDDRILLMKRSFSEDVQIIDASAGTRTDADLPEGTFANFFAVQRDGSIVTMGGLSDDPEAGIRLHRFFRDDAPVGQLVAKTLTRERDGHYRFTVQWRDDDGLYASWLGGDADDLTVGFPNATRRPAKLVDTEFADGGRLVTATYRVAAPDGVWDGGDSGKYTVRIERRSVQDVQFHVAARREIGVFHVQIPAVVPFLPTSAKASPFALAAANDREELDFDRLTGPPAA